MIKNLVTALGMDYYFFEAGEGERPGNFFGHVKIKKMYVFKFRYTLYVHDFSFGQRWLVPKFF